MNLKFPHSNCFFQMEIAKQLKDSYPLHFAILENDINALNAELQSRNNLKEIIDRPDPHGRTPIMLATMLGRLDLAEMLLDNGANANTQNKGMWSLSHEAILTKDSSFLKKVLTLRNYQQAIQTTKILRETNRNFKDTPDFYVEMAWEFTSWLPFIKNMCPSDTYKIYKHGNNIRIDANMLEISNSKERSAERNSDQSFIFRFPTDELVEIIFIDRNEGIAYVQNLELLTEPALEEFIPTESTVMQKIKSPITTTYVDVANVGFERSQKGSRLFSWIGSNDKEEEIEGYTCRVFTASNVEIVTKTCFDHLTEAEREEASKEDSNKTLSILMSLFEKKKVENKGIINNGAENCNEIDAIEYLGRASEAGTEHIGPPREEHIKTNNFNASLWLSESFPLNLREVFPIIDLMAVRNTKFSRLKRFIELQMPSGFPIRIKIPIFHLINAQITFRNINEPNKEAIEITATGADDEEADFLQQPFKLKQSLFDIPEGIERREMTGSLLFNRMDDVERAQTGGQDLRYHTVDVEDGGEYVYLLERFIGDQIPQTSTYEQQLQIAIEESLAAASNQANRNISTTIQINADGNEFDDGRAVATSLQSMGDDELQRALELSKLEEERRKKEIEDEEEEMRIALERSMLDQ